MQCFQPTDSNWREQVAAAAAKFADEVHEITGSATA